jgi:hypothetical protein
MMPKLTEQERKARKQVHNRRYYERNKVKWTEYRLRRQEGQKLESAEPPKPTPAET